MLLTIFTPTYNRSNTLPRLYRSLVRQTSKSFCWLIVDDGSTDNTAELIEQYKLENKIEIVYFRQENKGKPLAHNKGVELTTTELFTCVDSDDYLEDDAVEKIQFAWRNSKESDVGILAFKKTEYGIITKMRNSLVERSTLKGAYDKLGLQGDTMLIFRTEIVKLFAFPSFKDEKFVPEAFLYDKIDQRGTLLFLREPLYICEYLSDGYTSNMARLLYNNPNGYFAFINQRLSIDKGFKALFKDSIRFDAMAFAHKRALRTSNKPIWAFIAAFPGFLFYLRRYKKFVR